MTASFGLFNAVFNIEGQAESKLEALRIGTQKLNQSAMIASQSVRQIGTSLTTELKALSGKGISPEERMAGSVARDLERLSAQGGLTSTSMARLAKQLDQVALAARPRLSRASQAASLELQNLSTNLRFAEQTAGKTANRFQFMGDVSDRMAMSVRRASASAQGFMLGLSALQGNIMGLAFSLIFLQFTGFLKLSVAIAGLTLAGGILVKQLKKLYDQRREAARFAKELSAGLEQATRNENAFALATSRAKDTVADLGLAGDTAKELVKGLTTAVSTLRDDGISPTNTDMKVFTALFLTAKDRGKDFEEALNDATQGMLDLNQKVREGAPEAADEIEELERRAGVALGNFATEGGITIDAVVQAFKEKGKKIPPELQTIMDKSEGILLNFRNDADEKVWTKIVQDYELSADDLVITSATATERIRNVFREKNPWEIAESNVARIGEVYKEDVEGAMTAAGREVFS